MQIDMLRLGGIGTAKRLLAADGAQYGFEKLWECGRLDLTVECVVLGPKFGALFSDEELDRARKRLRDYGFDPERCSGSRSKGGMALPGFRRGHVWNRNQVRALMHSLYRRHLVGAFLVRVTKAEGANMRGDAGLPPRMESGVRRAVTGMHASVRLNDRYCLSSDFRWR